MGVFKDDFSVKYVGEDCFCVFKPPEDRVGVEVYVGVDGLGELGDYFEEAFKDVAVWAWNLALEKSGSHD
jgi:hypothetical protein